MNPWNKASVHVQGMEAKRIGCPGSAADEWQYQIVIITGGIRKQWSRSKVVDL